MSRILRYTMTALLLVACSKKSDSNEAAPSAPPVSAPPVTTPPVSAPPVPDPSAQATPPAEPTGPSGKELAAQGAPIVDVRTQEEWDEGHVEGATLIPVDEVEARVAEIEDLVGGDKSKPIVVVCRSGGRAGKAKETLEAHGFTQVVNGGKWQNLE